MFIWSIKTPKPHHQHNYPISVEASISSTSRTYDAISHFVNSKIHHKKIMPPEVSTSPACHNPQICSSVVPRSTANFSDTNKRSQLKRMEIALSSKRLIHILVFVLASMSIFRLVRFAVTSYSPSTSSGWAGYVLTCNISESSCKEVPSNKRGSSIPPNKKPITKKEYRFLSDIVTQRAPCNLLIFGWEPQYRRLAKINSAGTTVILVDTPEKIRVRRSNSTKVYKVIYDVKAREAYQLLKHARDGAACAPNSGTIETSNCKLALTNLPTEVYTIKWDVILIDGPGSDGPEAPGRMTTIYTSSMIARAGNITTNVVIHDVDRMIEKWFSREFLCEENLVSSKGRYWNFKIKGGEQWHSTSFCSQG